MDLLSTDIIMNLILPLLPKHALIALQHASHRYYRLVLSFFPYESRKHLKILGEICKSGFTNMLRWFLGRGRSELRWSLLIGGVAKLIKSVMDGNSLLNYTFFDGQNHIPFLVISIDIFSQPPADTWRCLRLCFF